MIKNIILQQKEERDSLLNQAYIERIENFIKADYLATGLIKLITGPRRAGKSVFSLQLLKNENFAYLNFDDELLLKHFNEDTVIQVLSETYPGFRYLLLDEVQNLPGWELWVNKLNRRGVNLVITGSNAKLLSHEMATVLTGRYIEIIVLPFSFMEFLSYHSIGIPVSPIVSPQQTGIVLSHLNTYLVNGGFPETVLNPMVLKNYLASLFDSVLLKDILKRFKIRQAQLLYDLSNYLISNFTNPFSFNQLKTDLNFSSVSTLQKMAGYLEEPFLFQYLTRYVTKIKAQLKSPKKAYIIDNGFIRARSFELSPNFGRLLENIVFIELLRRKFRPGLDLYYYKTRNDREIDFLCRSGFSVKQLIQVCYDISNPKTLKREINALSEASLELSCTRLLLISWDTEDEVEHNGLKIQIYPAWKWLAIGSEE